MKAIINAKIITEDEILKGYNLLYMKEVIAISKELPIWAETIDAKGAYLSAGFIDLHIHGSKGADVMDATPHALETISTSVLETGTTSFLATTMTMSEENIVSALENIKNHNIKTKRGSKILGVHLEGPFINPKKHGAQNPNYIQKPNVEFIEPYMSIIKMITLAPEVEGGEIFIKQIKEKYPKTILSIGHSDASFEKTKESFKWGVSHATHLFNAMNPFHHREPGIVGAVLESDEVSCEIIADMIHLHPLFFNILYQLKKEKLLLVTDAMRAGCISCGEYDLGGQVVTVKEGEARLFDGTLAGSVLKLNEALKNFYEHSDISLPNLIAMVTKTPAQKLGLKIGELKESYMADMVLFDKDFNILKTFVNGEMQFKEIKFEEMKFEEMKFDKKG
jgi:N-acetylglucosamine-6-phosphate deacetylase